MKRKILALITLIGFATCLQAGSKVWQCSASYSGQQQNGGGGSLYPTATTQFVAQITGSGSISGTANANSQNGEIVFIAGWFSGSVNEIDTGTAYAGDSVGVYLAINAHYAPGSYGTSKVTATW
ncbi:hypothetical protein [Pelagicoccus sp. SDUM812003]|uniref:hypothetical protein n=1 Tax=Pelagicoccus sp. SDUM812003 TaxID=3041267 RepID=UPI00280FCB1E|nr:hypothetical protein [Pelagicoccus sp. SDUM812003]MDQ8203514.1 hypothetical protein [Pelagicoccus sp. SDUM812003]